MPRLRRSSRDDFRSVPGLTPTRDEPRVSSAWTEADYNWITARIKDRGAAAPRAASSRALEGGYNLGALARSVVRISAALADL